MIAKQLINDSIVPLKASDTSATALSWMDDYRTVHLPVVDKNMDFLGLISEKDIFDMSDFDRPINDYSLSLNKSYINEYKHIYDVIRLVSDLKISVVPVLDNDNKYLGCIMLKDIVNEFAEMSAVKNPGGIIVLEMSINDYSLSEIAQIIESNDAKVLSLMVTSHKDSTKLELTLKINKIDISSIIQTFNRYNYLIKASYSEKDDIDDLKDRFDSFMKYLNI